MRSGGLVEFAIAANLAEIDRCYIEYYRIWYYAIFTNNILYVWTAFCR